MERKEGQDACASFCGVLLKEGSSVWIIKKNEYAPCNYESTNAKKCQGFFHLLYTTQPAPAEATLLRMPCSPAKQNASSKSLYNLRTGEAKVKSSLKLPWASKLRGFCPIEKMIGNPFLPRSGMNLKSCVNKAQNRPHRVPETDVGRGHTGETFRVSWNPGKGVAGRRTKQSHYDLIFRGHF